MPQTLFPIVSANTAGGNGSVQITFGADVADQLAKLQFSYGPDGWRYDVTTAQNEWLEAGLSPNEVAARVLSLVPAYIEPDIVGPENLYPSFADFFRQVDSIDIGEVVETPNSGPSGSVRIVEPSGDAAEVLVAGQLLFVDETRVVDPDGINLASNRFQWLRDGQEIVGEDTDSYRITQDDVGSTISVIYLFIDGLFNAESIVSAETPAVLAVLPEPPVEPEPSAEPEPHVAGLNISGDDFSNFLRGSNGDDTILGFAEDDQIRALEGNDVIDGGEGIDSAEYSGAQQSYTLTLYNDGFVLEDRRQDGDGTDSLVSVEIIDFNQPEDFDLLQFGGASRLTEQDFDSFIELYIAYFNRAPDAVGLNFWGTASANGISFDQMADLFFAQPETVSTYSDFLGENGTALEGLIIDIPAFVTEIYSNVLGRQFDQAGFDFWVDMLTRSAETGVSPSQFILEVLRGVQDGSQDRAYLDNKVDIGAYFAVHLGMSNTGNASAAMALFDGYQGSIDDAVAAIDGFYQDALDPNNGEFLMQVVGVLDNPFV